MENNVPDEMGLMRAEGSVLTANFQEILRRLLIG